jgi:hypothetical protein
MFDFAFGFAVALIAVMLGTHHYYQDRISKRIKKSQEDYSEMVAKNYMEGFKNLEKKYPDDKEPSPEDFQALIKNNMMKQFDGIEVLFQTLDLRFLLNITMLLWFIAITLFMVTGMFPYVSIGEFSLSGFSVPSMIAGTIAVIFACYGVYKISRKVW